MNLKDLKTPFPASDIEWRVGTMTEDKSKGTALAYLTNRAIMDRLDDVCGPENWKNDFREWKGGQLCGISILIGDAWITKWDGAEDSKIESLKGGLSDSMKRAAVQWGIGRYLYDLETSWVELDKYKHLSRIPSLPKWALPDGADTDDKKTTPPVQTPPKTPQPPKDTPKPAGVITKEQNKLLQDYALETQKNEEYAIACLKDLIAKKKVNKMDELKDYDDCRKFITDYDKNSLPFLLAPEVE